MSLNDEASPLVSFVALVLFLGTIAVLAVALR